MSDSLFPAPIAEDIWDLKYRLKDRDGTPIDLTVEDTWRRIAKALAAPETDKVWWEREFYRIMADFQFLPAGRIVAGAGAGRNVTLSNCYVMGTIPDSMDGIFTHLKEAALTMQAGGGIGYDFSPLRPKGAFVKGVSADASGPLTFMDCWDAMCRTVMSAGSRRGAMMATMSCDHPDIFDFIKAKQESGRLRMFNLSVLVTDDFMKAVDEDRLWQLIHTAPPATGDVVEVHTKDGVKYVHKIVQARDLWDTIMEATYSYAEPGVIFIDRVNRLHNLWYIDDIRATNPCGEKAMGPYDSCLLGSINLARFVENPYSSVNCKIDAKGLKATVKTAIRLMDNVIDVNYFPLPQQAEKARQTRQLGLGITGLADMLLMLGYEYGSERSIKVAQATMQAITIAAYEASIALAEEKGAFPAFDKIKFLNGDNFASCVLPIPLKAQILATGIRNSLLTSIAPTGTISLYAGNVSSGMEPIFAPSYTRKVLQPDGSKTEQLVEDYAVKLWREMGNEGLPPCYVDAQSLPPSAHIAMQGAIQQWVDSSISKTINLPADIPFEDFKDVYKQAYEAGCKGCTTYRPNDVTGSVLSVEEKPSAEAEAQHLRDLTSVTIGDVPGSWNDAPEARPDVLSASVYKLKAGTMEHAAYVTISDIVDEETGARRPFEIFVNTKDPAHQAWMTALTRMVSAIFRRPYDSSFVVEELKAVFDPTFSAFIEGRPVPSLVAAIGGVIEKHMQRIGYVESRTVQMAPQHGAIYSGVVTKESIKTEYRVWNPETLHDKAPALGPSCQKCFSTNVKNESGCLTCLDCGSSKCG